MTVTIVVFDQRPPAGDGSFDRVGARSHGKYAVLWQDLGEKRFSSFLVLRKIVL